MTTNGVVKGPDHREAHTLETPMEGPLMQGPQSLSKRPLPDLSQRARSGSGRGQLADFCPHS